MRTLSVLTMVALLSGSLLASMGCSEKAPGKETGAPAKAAPPEKKAVAPAKTSTPEKVAALVDAAYNGDVEKIKAALADGADINGKLAQPKPGTLPHLDGYVSKTALMVAIAKNRKEVIKALVEAKADPNVTEDNFKDTALHRACEDDNRTETVELLIKAGANVNAANKEGVTPLMVAAKSTKDMKLLKLLVDNKADKTLKDSSGRTAAEYPKFKAFDKWPEGEAFLK
jgi:hypothetical protein